jgi:hypothetical protein
MDTKYPDINSKTAYKYLNCGGFIGFAKDIKELLEDNDIDLDKFPGSNQYLWTQRYFKNTDKITLDTNCEIFCVFFTEIGKNIFLKQKVMIIRNIIITKKNGSILIF